MSKDKKNHAKKRVQIAEGTDLNGDSKLRQLEAALNALAEFRFNTITRFPEVKFKGAKQQWKRIDDFTLHTIVRRLKNKGITQASKTRVGELLESDFSPSVNPIQEYFKNLPSPTGDPVGELCATVELAGDPTMAPQREAMFRKYFEKWLVGAVANAFIEDRCANQLCFILAGPQGTFKSTWISNLCPPALAAYYVEGSLDPDNKDSMLATSCNFLFNLDDYFAGITSRKINEFKGLLTKNTVKVRRSYARYAEELPKICSFIASSNEAQFLHDPTGNRRFLPFEVNKIDIDTTQRINIDMVWSQAYRQFKEGFIYWLEKEDQVELAEYNEQFEVQSNEYEVLVTYMRPPDKEELPEADLTNAEILVHLQDKVSIKLSQKKLGEALRKAGFPRYQKQRNNHRSWVYGIIYADEADVYSGRQPTPPGSSKEQGEVDF
ncbi:VapE domain-containing protein [Flavilitoribacter nigricans]|uniref:Virulence protein n=1 Tax=Flavilitoribacter nigricans (strain ATCC 23147 / DSM 23189 / NBRC 102662 / NCIMB 1420 / SS-2) TaxID=1122177 RepID=A0A2D0MXJ1_FLAN2|nr:VapE domain-containing protein [Flavilitoribacter nigricans]PHN00927.1 virulence protein [Flavilitoribacter nigricans DSM 23189 = NBRC 102662]